MAAEKVQQETETASEKVQASQESIDNLTTVTTEGFAGVGRGQNVLKEGQDDISSKVQKMIQTKKQTWLPRLFQL